LAAGFCRKNLALNNGFASHLDRTPMMTSGVNALSNCQIRRPRHVRLTATVLRPPRVQLAAPVPTPSWIVVIAD